ncbi:hypothetical protein A9Q99_13060 [Gammaproteobacteria bacterium 45_16_T64]|nr:hypothetical protein A9Q99_13060 [Gammaproteobacteria bacterium 45_16_T64]
MGKLVSAFSPKRSFQHLFYRPQKGYPIFDGFRAIGMMWVILVHIVASAAMLTAAFRKTDEPLLSFQVDNTPWFLDWMWNGHLMVDMFFVLSGFLIAGLLFHEHEKTGNIRLSRFYYRRFMRLMPTYLLVAGLFYLANLPHRENLWQNLLYINNFFPHKETAAPWTWSLAVEEQFYLIFPLLTLYVLTKTQYVMRWLLGLLAFSSLIRLVIYITDDRLYGVQMSQQMIDMDLQGHYYSVLYDNLYTRFGAFICGIGALYVYRFYHVQVSHLFNHTIGGKLSLLAALLCLGCILQYNVLKTSVELSDLELTLLYGFERNLYSFCMSLLFLGMLCKVSMIRPLTWFFSLRLWYPFAQLTYCAYLIHLPIVMGVISIMAGSCPAMGFNCDYDNMNSLLVAFLIAVCLTYCISAIIYFMMERPLMSYRDFTSKELPPARSTSTVTGSLLGRTIDIR